MSGKATPVQRVVSLDNRHLSGLDRFDLWDEFSRRGIIGLQTSPLGRPDRFEFASTGILQDGFGMMSIQATPCRIARDPDQAPALWPDTVVVNFVRSGRLVIEQDGRSAVVEAGGGALCVADRRYALTLDGDFDGVILKFSRRLLSARAGLQRLTAVPFSTNPAIGALLHSYANALAQSAPALDAFTNARLMRSFVDTLQTSFEAIHDGDGARHSSYRRATFTRVACFVRTRLDDPAVTPGSIAEQLNLSPRYLRKLFAAEGTTLRRYIWDARLERSAVALLNTAESVTEIALRHGFKDLTHFSRSFRDRYGATPTAYRHERRPTPAASTDG